MKCIATWSFSPWLNDKGSSVWHSTVDMLACSVASIESFNKIYGRPTLYTDTLGRNVFSQLTNNCDFVVEYDGIDRLVPNTLWAYSKILTYSKQYDPYLHFDLDFIVHKDLELIDCDIAFQSFEHIGGSLERVYNLGRLYQHYKLPSIFPRTERELDSILCPNLGFLYMNDMKLNREYTDTAIKLVENNRELFKTDKKLHICSVEQQTLGCVLKYYKKIKSKVLLNNHKTDYPFNDYFTHFIGGWKQKKYPGVIELQDKHYGSYKTNNLIEIAKFLDNLKYSLRH